MPRYDSDETWKQHSDQIAGTDKLNRHQFKTGSPEEDDFFRPLSDDEAEELEWRSKEMERAMSPQQRGGRTRRRNAARESLGMEKAPPEPRQSGQQRQQRSAPPAARSVNWHKVLKSMASKSRGRKGSW